MGDPICTKKQLLYNSIPSQGMLPLLRGLSSCGRDCIVRYITASRHIAGFKVSEAPPFIWSLPCSRVATLSYRLAKSRPRLSYCTFILAFASAHQTCKTSAPLPMIQYPPLITWRIRPKPQMIHLGEEESSEYSRSYQKLLNIFTMYSSRLFNEVRLKRIKMN